MHRPPSRTILIALAGLLVAVLGYSTGLQEGIGRSSRGEGLRLVRDEDDASCLEILDRELAAWPRGSIEKQAEK